MTNADAINVKGAYHIGEGFGARQSVGTRIDPALERRLKEIYEKNWQRLDRSLYPREYIEFMEAVPSARIGFVNEAIAREVMRRGGRPSTAFDADKDILASFYEKNERDIFYYTACKRQGVEYSKSIKCPVCRNYRDALDEECPICGSAPMIKVMYNGRESNYSYMKAEESRKRAVREKQNSARLTGVKKKDGLLSAIFMVLGISMFLVCIINGLINAV